MRTLFESTTQRVFTYLDSIQTHTVAPTDEAIANLKLFDEPLPGEPTDPEKVLEQLDEIGSPATMDDVEKNPAAMLRIVTKKRSR